MKKTMRKAAHASEYALLGFLLAGMYYSYGWPGRAGRISDVLIDSGGVLAGVLLVLALRIWGSRQRSE